MKRREFVVRFGGGLLAVPMLLKFTACGGDDDDGDDGTDGADVDAAGGGGSFMGMTSSADQSFHTHTFTIQCSALDGTSLQVTATGSGHTHSIELDSGQLSTLASGGTVEFSTTNGGHAHEWTVTGSC